MQRIFDSHAHYDDKKFGEDLSSLAPLFDEMRSNGVVGIINAGSDIPSSRKSIYLSEQYPEFIYASAGIHPHAAKDVPADYIEQLRTLCARDGVVAVGEIGLDYHYDFSPRDRQKEIFRGQLALANELSLPVIVHDREAHADTLALLREFKPRGVIHCFSGSVEMAREVVSLGMYIGLGGAVTFKNARVPLEVAAAVPSDRLLLETDAPYMAPVPHRGELCRSDMIEKTADKIAAVRGTTRGSILELAEENARRLFSI
jgi:TatD DNase family protein